MLEYLVESEITRILSMNKNINRFINEVNNQNLGKNGEYKFGSNPRKGVSTEDHLQKHLEGSGGRTTFNIKDMNKVTEYIDEGLKSDPVKS